jgi:RNA ligase-like protein
MGYAHIENLYRPEGRDILMFKECYAMEKVHGTSAHVAWDESEGLRFFSGEQQANFEKLFDHKFLTEQMAAVGPKFTVYGEAYGGKCQGMKDTYGPDLRFIAFDVKIGEHTFLSIPDAAGVVASLAMEFVPYVRTFTDVETLDKLRDMPSEVAVMRGMGVKEREGIVVRPLIEVRKNNGERICAKHKGAKFAELASTPRVTATPLEEIKEAQAVAEQFVTPMRLTHVLDKLPGALEEGLQAIPKILSAMIADVTREGKGEFISNHKVVGEISRRTVLLYKQRLGQTLLSRSQEAQS